MAGAVYSARAVYSDEPVEVEAANPRWSTTLLIADPTVTADVASFAQNTFSSDDPLMYANIKASGVYSPSNFLESYRHD